GSPGAPPALLSFPTRRSSDLAPVVFVHGSLGDLQSWNGQETQFAQIYRVLVYSRRYHPPNPQVDDNQTYSPKLHAEDLAAMLLTDRKSTRLNSSHDQISYAVF